MHRFDEWLDEQEFALQAAKMEIDFFGLPVDIERSDTKELSQKCLWVLPPNDSGID
jgi:hypothetical protein